MEERGSATSSCQGSSLCLSLPPTFPFRLTTMRPRGSECEGEQQRRHREARRSQGAVEEPGSASGRRNCKRCCTEVSGDVWVEVRESEERVMESWWFVKEVERGRLWLRGKSGSFTNQKVVVRPPPA
ncbi:unnamed protein product [Pleuronectes platessa]|uniref:Uncharacterized protein n=1 Tax=Pleuronectes platessa TaxID=8262 RepID=A0A9N7YKF6_PLEPL|nr:unnamed protein product [Pleuronectes platessa]